MVAGLIRQITVGVSAAGGGEKSISVFQNNFRIIIDFYFAITAMVVLNAEISVKFALKVNAGVIRDVSVANKFNIVKKIHKKIKKSIFCNITLFTIRSCRSIL